MFVSWKTLEYPLFYQKSPIKSFFEVLSSNRRDAWEASHHSPAGRRQDETTTGQKVAPRSPKERRAGEERSARRSGPTGTRRAEVGSRREVWFIVAGSCFTHCPPVGRKRGSPLSRFTRGPGKPDQETRKRVCAYTHPQRRRPDREIFQVSRDQRSCSDAKCQRREVSRSRHLVSTPFRVKAFFPCPAFPGPAAAPQVLSSPSSPDFGKSYARRGRARCGLFRPVTRGCGFQPRPSRLRGQKAASPVTTAVWRPPPLW